jgi:hypothetical protein
VWRANRLKIQRLIMRKYFWTHVFSKKLYLWDVEIFTAVYKFYQFSEMGPFRSTFRLNFFKKGVYAEHSPTPPKSFLKTFGGYLFTGWAYFIKFFSK